MVIGKEIEASKKLGSLGKVEMKAGLEIHQQLDSHKLFCHCPSILRNDKPDFKFTRRLHAVAGESGEVDIAAKHEAEKENEFIYEAYRDTTCLLEYDECPPYPINEEALKIAVQISLLLNCEIIQTTQIMRKTVLNGSNTSGFQRTLMLAKNGFIETSFGRVGIDSVFLEEDSARPASSHDESDPELENSKIYKLDRLGIPLVEIATGPHMYYPEQVKETALKLGEILRACKVKRGIGTIRQDLNVSTPNHVRVEIKGFQDPAMMIKTIELEIERQNKEGKKGKSEVRKANVDGATSFLRPMPGASRMYPETDLPLLHISRDFINEAKENLPKLKTEIRGELKQKGLSDEMIKLVLESGKINDFEFLLKIYNNPNFVAKVLFILPKEIASHEKINEDIFNIDIIETILRAVAEKKISESDVKHVMEQISKGKSIYDALKIEKVESSDIEGEIAKIVKEKPGLSAGAYMGLVMAKFKGKVDGKTVSEILKKLVK